MSDAKQRFNFNDLNDSANQNEPKISSDNSTLEQNNEQSEQPEQNSIQGYQETILKQTETIQHLNEKFLRLAAEFENYKKLSQKEKEESRLFAASSLLKNLIVPLEHLFMALSVNITESNTEAQNIFKGVDMTKIEFLRVLESAGLERIFPMGKKFDPNTHQAISQIQKEGVEPGTIIQVVQAGYALNGRTIKVAMVVVAQ